MRNHSIIHRYYNTCFRSKWHSLVHRKVEHSAGWAYSIFLHLNYVSLFSSTDENIAMDMRENSRLGSKHSQLTYLAPRSNLLLGITHASPAETFRKYGADTVNLVTLLVTLAGRVRLKAPAFKNCSEVAARANMLTRPTNVSARLDFTAIWRVGMALVVTSVAVVDIRVIPGNRQSVLRVARLARDLCVKKMGKPNVSVRCAYSVSKMTFSGFFFVIVYNPNISLHQLACD